MEDKKIIVAEVWWSDLKNISSKGSFTLKVCGENTRGIRMNIYLTIPDEKIKSFVNNFWKVIKHREIEISELKASLQGENDE